jgi:hypothetical protein
MDRMRSHGIETKDAINLKLSSSLNNTTTEEKLLAFSVPEDAQTKRNRLMLEGRLTG